MVLQRSDLKKAKRVVVKVGSSTITHQNGKRDFGRIDRLAREMSDLQNQGREMILVTSGAVAVGVDRLGLPEKPRTIPGKQAAAAIGHFNAYLRKVLCRIRANCGAGTFNAYGGH